MATDNQLRPKPAPGTPCQICSRATWRWVADHCHTCDDRADWAPSAFRGWICDECNKTITEHMERYRPQIRAYLKTHHCDLTFDGMPPPTRWKARVHRARLDPNTKRLDLVNGTVDRTYLIVGSAFEFVTVQQLAAWLGVAGPTIRGYIRNGRIREVWTPEPGRRNGVRLIPRREATRFILEYQQERMT